MDSLRRGLLRAVATSAPLVLWGRQSAAAQCPAGLIAVRAEISQQVVYFEAELSIARGGAASGKIRIPVVIQTMITICEPAPPKDPPKPKSGWDSYGSGGFGSYAWVSLDAEGFDSFFTGLSVRTRLPSFTRLSVPTAKLTTVAGLTDGTTVSMTHGLRHNGAEFRPADISSVRPFMQTYGPRIATLEQRLSDIEVEATADGADRLGVDTCFQGRPLLSTDRLVHASSSGALPPGFVDPLGLPRTGR
jgi:hypothetical protein